jgi:hypothetical protein
MCPTKRMVQVKGCFRVALGTAQDHRKRALVPIRWVPVSVEGSTRTTLAQDALVRCESEATLGRSRFAALRPRSAGRPSAERATRKGRPVGALGHIDHPELSDSSGAVHPSASLLLLKLRQTLGHRGINDL